MFIHYLKFEVVYAIFQFFFLSDAAGYQAGPSLDCGSQHCVLGGVQSIGQWLGFPALPQAAVRFGVAWLVRDSVVATRVSCVRAGAYQ